MVEIVGFGGGLGSWESQVRSHRHPKHSIMRKEVEGFFALSSGASIYRTPSQVLGSRALG